MLENGGFTLKTHQIVIMLKNLHRIKYFWLVIVDCLLCCYHVSLKILGPDCPLRAGVREPYDFKLFTKSTETPNKTPSIVMFWFVY